MLKAFKVAKTVDGRSLIYERVNVHKWLNKEIEDFDFDIMNPDDWKLFLRDDFRLPNGKKIPLFTEYKEKMVYEVFALGVPMFMRDVANNFHQSRQGSYYSFFPGYTEDIPANRDELGKLRKRDMFKFGVLN